MAEKSSASIAVRSETKDLKKVHDQLVKTMGQISYFQTKAERHEKFTKKDKEDANKALAAQLKMERDTYSVLQKTEQVLSRIKNTRKELAKLKPAAGSADEALMKQLSSTARSLAKTRSDTERAYNEAVGGRAKLQRTAVTTDAKSSSLDTLTEMVFGSNPGTALLAAAIMGGGRFAMQGLRNDWETEKSMANYSMLGYGGTLNANRLRSASRSALEDYTTPGLSAASADEENKQYMWTARINRDFNQSARWQMRGRLGGTGIAVNPEEAANALAMTGMGYSAEQIEAYRKTAIAGGVGSADKTPYNPLQVFHEQNKADYLSKHLTRIFSDGVQLGMSGLTRGEYMDSIRGLEEAAQKTAAHTDPEEFRKVMKIINAQGGPAFYGARGGEFAQGLAGGLLNPGGGIAGKLLSLRIAGFKGDYFGSQVQLGQGLDIRNKEGIDRVFGGLAKYAPEAAAMGLKAWSGNAISEEKAFEYLTKTYYKTRKPILPTAFKKIAEDVDYSIQGMSGLASGQTAAGRDVAAAGTAAAVQDQISVVGNRIINLLGSIDDHLQKSLSRHSGL